MYNLDLRHLRSVPTALGGQKLKIVEGDRFLMPSCPSLMSRLGPCSTIREYNQAGLGGDSMVQAVRGGPWGVLGYEDGLLKLPELEDPAL